MMPTMKSLSIVFICLILLLAAGPAWADETKAADAKGDAIDIRLQLDSENMSINGKDQQIEKPYLSNDTTLVPLRVITASFGATISWDSATQEIRLKYGEHTIQLFIGKAEAVVDKETVEMPTAPELTNGTTMVPLRFISETFGASVSFDEETSQIKITGKKHGATNSGIDVDVGKTQIGNSYYGWSMKYPAGLVKQNEIFREDYDTFTDAEGEYRLSVGVEDLDNTLSKDGLLKKLADYTGNETVLDKKYVVQGTSGYARIVTKTGSDSYKEYRGFMANDRFYYVTMTVNEEGNYKNPDKNQSYTDLLDSFRTSFDRNDRTVKDLSTVKDGFRKYTDDDYGISVDVPADWYKSYDNSRISFYDKEETGSISIIITSIVEGDSLDKWVNRRQNELTTAFVADYFKSEPAKDITLSRNPAKRWNYSYSLGDAWSYETTVYLFKGKYKYKIIFTKEKGQLSNTLIQQVLDSFAIDQDQMNESLGFIQDGNDFLNKSKRSTINRKSEKYSINIPEYWVEDDTDDHMISYLYFPGGAFFVMTQNDTSMAQLRKGLDALLESKRDASTNYKKLSDKSVQIDGASGQLVEFQDKEQGAGLKGQVYIFEKDGIGYEIFFVTPLASDTDDMKQIIQDTVDSFRFLKS
jgi:hypothetical protein